MRILITGGAGFLGSHLADLLLEQGHSVVALDDLSTGNAQNVSHLSTKSDFELVVGSILDEQLVEKLMANSEGCFHLAAAVGVNLIVEKPLESLTTNIRGSEVVMQAALDHSVKTLVASSSEIYGKNTSDLLHEDEDRILGSPLKVRWTYSEAKAIEEALAHTLYRQRGLPTIIARLFNVVGPRQTGTYGMVLPRFCYAALHNAPLKVYGSGEQTRVFCHATDAVQALYSLFLSNKGLGEAFNIGGTEEISILDLAHRVVKIAQSNSPIVSEPYDTAYEPGFEDMPRRVPDLQRIKNLTGWEPKLTLDEVIEDVLSYQKATGLN